jgi:hypothetical protein
MLDGERDLCGCSVFDDLTILNFRSPLFDVHTVNFLEGI